MKCPQCGNEVEEGAVFCDQCGAKLEAPAPTSAPVPAPAEAGICPSCGASNVPGEAFCEGCGAPLETPAPAEAPPTPAPPTTPEAEGACPACGAALQPGDTFCSTCGAAVTAAPPPAPEPAAPPPPAAEAPPPPEPAAPPPPAAEAPPAPEPAAPPPPEADKGPSTAEVPLVTACPSCGGEVTIDDPFCSHCGATLAPPVEAPPPSAAPAPIEQPCLVVAGSGARIPLPQAAEIVIGREDPVSGVYPDIDLTPHGGEEGGVSRQHAKLIVEGEEYLIQDLKSTNFTFVNRQKLTPGVRQPLKDGDEIRCGRVKMSFHTG